MTELPPSVNHELESSNPKDLLLTEATDLVYHQLRLVFAEPTVTNSTKLKDLITTFQQAGVGFKLTRHSVEAFHK